MTNGLQLLEICFFDVYICNGTVLGEAKDCLFFESLDCRKKCDLFTNFEPWTANFCQILPNCFVKNILS